MGHRSTRPRVGLISLEPWDQVWRRNQHLVAELLAQELVANVVFINPPAKLRHIPRARPRVGVTVVTPHLLLPRRRGGAVVTGAETSVALRSVDVLWVNDAVTGIRCMRRGMPVVYDVTDDWRTADLGLRERMRLIAAEDALAHSATTVVCSQVLVDRWHERYGVCAALIQNGVDLAGHGQAQPEPLPGPGPHALYVGTLHRERLNIPLLMELARSGHVGQVDLVGPDHLDQASRLELAATGRVRLAGQVGHERVPGLMAGADVLICPHRVDDFTMSLDAIKSFEYLASPRPIVATPTSGFQLLNGLPGMSIASPPDFVKQVAQTLSSTPAGWTGRAAGHGWCHRARAFAGILDYARTGA